MQSSNATLTESARTGFPARVKAYVQLVKPRLTLLVVFSAIFGYMMAPNVVGINLWTVIALGLGGFLITGASNTLNQVIEAEYDRLMTRTQNRPMAKKVISPLEGVIFALVCGSAGITLLGLVFEGLVPALLGVIALLLYAFVYTPLKRVNSIAVFVGAFPGAMPPLIGWAAATGTLSTEALVLFLMQFLWQFPHFWAIAWVLEDDYKKAGFKMLPSNAGRSGFTASIILVYTLLLVPVVILPLAVGMSGWITTVVLGLAGAGFSIQAFILLQTRTIKSASRLMFGSFIYLPIVQIAMLIDKFLMDMGGMAVEANEKKYIIHPAKFNLWLFIVSIILLFGALTSAYIVSKGIESDKDMWHYFSMPKVLWLNTGILLVASVMLQIGLWGARKGDFRRAKIGFSLTMLLGLIFLAGQVVAWFNLTEEGVVFGAGGSNSGNYLYVITCLHGLHIVAGLIFMGYVYVRLMGNRYHPGNIVGIENAATFWHFLGLLWLYLFIFLLLNQGNPLV